VIRVADITVGLPLLCAPAAAAAVVVVVVVVVVIVIIIFNSRRVFRIFQCTGYYQVSGKCQ
jgi:hypothetical protein